MGPRTFGGADLRVWRILLRLVLGLMSFAILPACVGPQQPCPRLEDRLYRLTTSPDPEAYARQADLYYSQGRVRVIIELESAEDRVPQLPGLTIESRAGELVQALVPVERLCELAAANGVRLVRSPAQPVR